MKALSENEMRTLVGLLDDEDPASLTLVRDQILRIGEPILPFLDDFRASCPGALTARVDALSHELKVRNLKTAFARFSASADCDLEKGSWLVCRVGYAGINPAVYTDWLDKVALGIRRALPQDADHYATMQQLNITLFQELGFSGNEKRYYDPDNTYLNRVIETRRGIPVSLSVLYLLIGRRLGLPLFGVGTPGHFLVGFRESNQSSFFIDPFHKGRLLNAQDVRRMLLRSGYEFRHEYLEKASNREILARMMRNLISIYQKSGVTDRSETLSVLVEMILAGRRDQQNS
jgi:regulator of sirC expression with transglutaminase-like and TPR domain